MVLFFFVAWKFSHVPHFPMFHFEKPMPLVAHVTCVGFSPYLHPSVSPNVISAQHVNGRKNQVCKKIRVQESTKTSCIPLLLNLPTPLTSVSVCMDIHTSPTKVNDIGMAKICALTDSYTIRRFPYLFVLYVHFPSSHCWE